MTEKFYLLVYHKTKTFKFKMPDGCDRFSHIF